MEIASKTRKPYPALRWWLARLHRRARSLHGLDRQAWKSLALQLRPGSIWRDRTVVLLFAALTGVLVVGFTFLAEAAIHAYRWLFPAGEWISWAALLWTPAFTVGIVWWTRRFVSGAAGSGIPQVVRALDDDLGQGPRERLISLRVALHKVGLVSAGLLGGLSIGREGPTVQVGAGVMVHAQRFLSAGSRIDGHDLMVAGAAAGIAAAFNTPLGGIVFALEQLSRRRGIQHSTLVIASIVMAGLISVSVFGNETYFGRLRVQDVSLSLLGPGLAIALATGLLGGLFSRLMVVSTAGLPDRFSHWRRVHPLRFAAGCGLAVAIIGLVTDGLTAGAGAATTRALLEGESEGLPIIYTTLKFCATWISAWSGVPAGVFAPSLSIGAGIGSDVAFATGHVGEASIPLIALGMVGFLAATTSGPITAFIIVMEMVSGHSMVLSLMACAFISAGISRLIAKPMYTELAALLPVASEPPEDRLLPHSAPEHSVPSNTGRR
jgi:H+/Cl- antiporter ClcA